MKAKRTLKRKLKKLGSTISGAAIGTVTPLLSTADMLGLAVVAVALTPLEMIEGAIEGGKMGKDDALYDLKEEYLEHFHPYE